MTIRKISPEELLSLDNFTVDEEEPHIILNKAICANCSEKPCLIVCPAVLYTIKDEEINFDYAGCLECGTCRIVCKNKGIKQWKYPRGTFGVAFRNG
ncbi:MAG: 4Fe-4S ferredoxin, iron-sulpur binding protein [Firmicutes bacterium]|nr:4Fe-4S ferredoxin, iron-sulpur binding protein [Bacillota bacterium]